MLRIKKTIVLIGYILVVAIFKKKKNPKKIKLCSQFRTKTFLFVAHLKR